MLFVAAFPEDGGRAVVEDGGGLYGGQAAHGDGPSAARGDGVHWTWMCF